MKFCVSAIMVVTTLWLATLSEGAHNLTDTAAAYPEIAELAAGNVIFRRETDPKSLEKLVMEGQKPHFMLLGCSDSRVSDIVFHPRPGTLFTQRNVANRFDLMDASAAAALAYAVAEARVKHIIVLGHYGCGGVAAGITNAPEGRMDAATRHIQAWITPIRKLYETSTRPEIVALRYANLNKTEVDTPKYTDAGFRALIEENVKQSVETIARDAVVQNHWAAYNDENAGNKPAEDEPPAHDEKPLQPVTVHGFVYEMKTGMIIDLGISQGPRVSHLPIDEVKGHARRLAEHH